METCGNCGRTIGNLETPHVYGENIVCTQCIERLPPIAQPADEFDPMEALASAAAPSRAAPGINYATPQRYSPPPVPDSPATWPVHSSAPRCPACGYLGQMKKTRKGSIVILIVLLLIWILPGILYALFNNGYQYVCPNCGGKIADAA